MQKEIFQQLAGGIFHSSEHWKHLSSEQKQQRFWAFHTKLDRNTFSLYAGVSVKTLLRQKQYSIEHIIPRSYLEDHLINEPHTLRFGATVNPFNLAASHKRINARRGSAQFDFDDDAINKIYCTPFRSIHDNQIGFDKQGEWIVPYRSRGDIARSVLYMHLMYPLPPIPKDDLEALIAWGKMDMPSKWERQYSVWIDKEMGLNNPFITIPTLVEDEELFNSISR